MTQSIVAGEMTTAAPSPLSMARRSLLAYALAVALGLAGCGGSKHTSPQDIASDAPAGTARHALLVAEAAASSWMRDAHLIYVENDSPLVGGETARWGFLFRSEMADSWRNVSVENGRVVREAPLGFPFAAPDLPTEWIDSSAAVARAEESGGREFREKNGGELEHAVLGRGVFTAWDGPATWTVVYRGADRSELAIVVNAADGTILSRFEG
jgi:hypothetical protein